MKISVLIFTFFLQNCSIALAIHPVKLLMEQSNAISQPSPDLNNDCPTSPPSTFNCNSPGQVSFQSSCPNILTSKKCLNFGSCNLSNGRCDCPIGFGGDTCSQPLCGANGDGNRPVLPANQTKCECSDGWSGINCNVCTNDKVCTKYLDPYDQDVKGVCYKGGIFVRNYFHMCSIENDGLKTLLRDRVAQATFQCSKEDITSPAICQFEFWIDYKENFGCKFTDCSFIERSNNGKNTYGGMCQTATCECIPNSLICGQLIDIGELMPQVKGPASFICKDPPNDNGRYNCEFDEPAFSKELGPFLGSNTRIELNCNVGECLGDYEIPKFSHGLPADMIMFLTLSTLCLLAVTLSIGYCVLEEHILNIFKKNTSETIDSEITQLLERGRLDPITLTFKDLSYEISKNGQRIRVLRGVSGVVKPGEVLAIMGTSGAGKSTCLDILASKSKRGTIGGQVLVNGQIPSRKHFKRISGFVDQEDTLLGTLTVYESVLYSALLRLPKIMSRAAKEKRVMETLSELGIEKIAHSRIGSPGQRGISGGEKRRVSIAMELVTGPSVLFLDEPTSGLDSYNALSVVQSLVSLARDYNRTIIMTIHQPRSNIFSLFNKLLLLAEGGYMVYSGPISKEKNSSEDHQPDATILHSYLDDLGISCPTGFNVADFLIDITSNKNNGDTMEGRLEQHSNLINNDPSSSDMSPRSRKKTTSSDYLRMKKLSTSALMERWENRVPHLTMNPRDSEDLRSRPTLLQLVTNFLKSDVCKILSDELTMEYHPHLDTSSIDQNIEPAATSANITTSTPVEATDNETEPLVTNESTNEIGSYHEHPPSYSEINSHSPRERTSTVLSWLSPSTDSESRASWATQFRVLSWRTFKNITRNPFLLIAHYIIAVSIGLICSIVFWNQGKTMAAFQNRLGLFFFLGLVNALINLTTVDIFSKERTLFTRERANGYHGVSAYFLSKVTCDILPLRLIPPLITGAIIYGPVNLIPDSIHFFKFLLAFLSMNLAAASLVFIFAAAFAAASTANFVNVVVLVIGLLFGGLFVNRNSVLWPINLFRIYSPFNYGFEAMCINEMAGLRLRDRIYGQDIDITGGVILNVFGFSVTSYWWDVAALIEQSIIYFSIAFFVLQVLVKETR